MISVMHNTLCTLSVPGVDDGMPRSGAKSDIKVVLVSRQVRALEDAQRRLGSGGSADLGGERCIAQHARRLIVVACGRGDVDAQQNLAPAMQHVPEQMRHLSPHTSSETLPTQEMMQLS